jgi:hypothetical protein
MQKRVLYIIMGMTILCLMVILILMYLPVLESESNVLIKVYT